MNRHARPPAGRALQGRGWRPWLAVMVGAVAAAVAFAVVQGHRPAPTAAVSAAAPAVPVASPLLVRTGVVGEVNDDGTVQVGSERITLAGLATPAAGQCGHDQAIAAERAALAGQPVTLVPDPAVPSPGVAHVVTHAQLSYTDAAIATGMGRPAPGAWTYAAVFTREAGDARSNDAGLWPTCWAGDR